MSHRQTLRIPGVLQRFSICYIVVGALQVAIRPAQPGSGRFDDIKQYWLQWIIVACLELISLMLTFFLAVPDCPLGYLGPGGLHDSSKHWNCSGGAAGYIDIIFFGANHIDKQLHGTRQIYEPDQYYFGTGKPVPSFDPLGILGSINSILIVFFGLQAGKIFLYFPNYKHRIIRFFVWGCEYYI